MIHIKTFTEAPVCDASLYEPSEYDIICPYCITPGTPPGKHVLAPHEYCIALLDRFFVLPKSGINDFLLHHASLVTNPIVWWNDFAELLEMNHEVFSAEQRSQARKALLLIEVHLLKSEIPDKRNAVAFDFNEVKKHLKTLKNTAEKLHYLIGVQAEYLQNLPARSDNDQPSFDRKICIEIEKIKAQDEICCWLKH